MVRQAVKVVVILALLMAVMAGAAQASVNLTTIGTAQISGDVTNTPHNLIYDSSQSLLWLDYSYGGANQTDSKSWADALILTAINTPGYIDNFSGLGWRLPTTGANAMTGADQSDSEMGCLYYTDLLLKAGAGAGVTGVGSTNQLPFATIHSDYYWSGTDKVGDAGTAWMFVTSNGSQYAAGKSYDGGFALAVRSGQLLTSAVPEPSTYLLLGIALGVVGYARRRMSVL